MHAFLSFTEMTNLEETDLLLGGGPTSSKPPVSLSQRKEDGYLGKSLIYADFFV